ncbi:Tat protein [SIV-wrc Pbt-05GM-X02]|uniref:Protein Tat n=1 Tax=SIV-wrc Pbt-05GM-X02 TaxID=498715 RepID=B3CKG2_SIV|nr:Tat protein [SIV-wrc Pbt-05GM-X02]
MKNRPLCTIFTGSFKEDYIYTSYKDVPKKKRTEKEIFKEQNNFIEIWKGLQEIREELSRETLSPCNHQCRCKKCIFSCQLCFLQKGLGISYHSYSKKTNKDKSDASTR